MKQLPSFFFFLLIAAVTMPLMAQESTTVIVRAQSKDAKFIGTSMGGALITITNAETGEILAEGVTEGSTGDTGRLIQESHERYEQLSTDDAAKFEASLSLEDPTFVTVTARAPQVQKQSAVKSSTQLWLIPGKNITGDGIILEVPGLAIDILQPQAHERTTGSEVLIRANLVMMCGCPTEPGGMWDSSEMEIKALVQKNGETIEELDMKFTGKTSTYEATFEPDESGAYMITVFGYDPRTGNTGLDKSSVIVN